MKRRPNKSFTVFLYSRRIMHLDGEEIDRKTGSEMHPKMAVA